MDRFVGLDLSLNGTGVAILRREESKWLPPELHTLRQKHKGEITRTYEAQRLRQVLAELQELDILGSTLVAIEDYAWGIKKSQTNCTFSLGELGGLVRHFLLVGSTPYINVPIKSSKQFATGNGSAKKPQVASAMVALWNITIEKKKDWDEADALALASLAAFRYYGTLPDLKIYRFQSTLVASLEIVQ